MGIQKSRSSPVGGSRQEFEKHILKYRDVNTTWQKMLLAPGRNMLALDCDDLDQRAAMSVTVFYTPLYLEVQ